MKYRIVNNPRRCYTKPNKINHKQRNLYTQTFLFKHEGLFNEDNLRTC